ncbi:MAG: hypothetical protein LQ341_003874 [Variospora aurantia]|nr:MAG: hypothetical protein LQ341_003874 [Variospora aurantia]
MALHQGNQRRRKPTDDRYDVPEGHLCRFPPRDADLKSPVRAVLGFWNAACLLYYRNGVAQAFGANTANWFVLFQASGFHIMYYASRSLPNFFAFGLVTIAFGKLLPTLRSSSASHTTRRKTFLTLLTTTGVIFRSELALLLIPRTLHFLLRRELSLSQIISSGILGFLIGISITVPIDSLLWQRFPLWPEFSAFSYNVLHSQSSNWGTSPWHFYLTSALPRLLFNPLTYILCIPLSFTQPALRCAVADLVVPNLAFVLLYSLQPHKEWRFIIYVIPPLLTAAALGANWIWIRRAKTLTNRLLALVLIVSVAGSFAASTLMLAVSRLNYPGADALHRLHALAPTHHAPGAMQQQQQQQQQRHNKPLLHLRQIGKRDSAAGPPLLGPLRLGAGRAPREGHWAVGGGGYGGLVRRVAGREPE